MQAERAGGPSTACTRSDIGSLDTPAVLVDIDKMDRNLQQMRAISEQRQVALRPHAKTHKSSRLVQMQMDSGAIGITVAKLDEAETLSRLSGCSDVFLAYPIVSGLKAQRAADLAHNLDLSLTIDTTSGADVLNSAAERVDKKLKVLIEIDSGLRRCGISPDDVGDFIGQIRHHRHLEVVGVFTHAGHSYGAKSRTELEDIARQEVACVTRAAAAARRAGVNATVTSVGSTPTILANVDDLDDATEIRPGNYIFKDRMQVSLGGASLDECALSVLCTVVSTASGNAVIDAGSKTFGQDRGAHGNLGVEGFGIGLDGKTRLDRLSEEHGVITGGASWLEPGDRLQLVPNHACIVADLARVLHAVDGDRVVGSFAVDVRGGGS